MNGTDRNRDRPQHGIPFLHGGLMQSLSHVPAVLGLLGFESLQAHNSDKDWYGLCVAKDGTVLTELQWIAALIRRMSESQTKVLPRVRREQETLSMPTRRRDDKRTPINEGGLTDAKESSSPSDAMRCVI